MKFFNSSFDYLGNPIDCKIKSIFVNKIGNWNLREKSNVNEKNEISIQIQNKDLTLNSTDFNITLNKATGNFTEGEISPTITNVPINVKIGGSCENYNLGEITSPAFNINWLISK